MAALEHMQASLNCFARAAIPCAEEEQLVFDDRTTDHEAKLVAGVLSFRDIVSVVVVRVCGVGGEPVELPQAAVEIVTARFAADVDDAAQRPPILGVKVISEDAKFLDGILGNEKSNAGVKEISVLNPIEKDLRAGGTLPIDGETDTAIGAVLTPPLVCTLPLSELRSPPLTFPASATKS